MPTLLVVDDEPAILRCFRLAFQPPQVNLVTASTATEGLAQFGRHQPEVVILDVDLPDQSGLETFQQIHELDPRVPVIFITGGSSTNAAIEAMALGAYEYLQKPLRLNELYELISKAFEVSYRARVPAVVEEAGVAEDADVLVGRCPGMQEVYKSIGRVAPQGVTALILGESGTGKELVARAIYRYSRRAHGPFLAINCAAIPETLLESELFGHEKGAFTGADRKRIGRFEQCHGGTLFLDEVGDMSPLTQTKILRVLQEKRFERVGGTETIHTDVRVIAATNCDLKHLVDSGRFRSDLYYQLNVYTINLPPLRDRGEDLPLLVDHFLRRFRQELDRQVLHVAAETMELLRRYPWPGNIRELQSIIKQALLQCTGTLLLPDHLPPAVRGSSEAVTPPSGQLLLDLERFIQQRLQNGSNDLYSEWQGVAEGHLFTQVLRHTGGNLSQAARILGINRITLRSRLRNLGLASKGFTSKETELAS